jgi:hypothetical protein
MPIGRKGIQGHLPTFRRAIEAAGRDPDSATVIPFGSMPDPGKLEYFGTLGIDHVVLGLDPGTREEILPVLDKYASVVAPFREAS